MGTFASYRCQDIACTGLGLTLGLNDFRAPERHFGEIGFAVSAMFVNLYVGAGGRFESLKFEAPQVTLATGFMMFMGFGRVYALRPMGEGVGFEAGLALVLPASKWANVVDLKSTRSVRTPDRASSEDLGGQIKRVDIEPLALNMSRSLKASISMLKGCENRMVIGRLQNRTDQNIKTEKIREILVKALRETGIRYVRDSNCKITGHISMNRQSNLYSYQITLHIDDLKMGETRWAHGERLQIRVDP